MLQSFRSQFYGHQLEARKSPLDIENFTKAIFYCSKSHIGRHLRRHCRLPPPIPMAATST